MEEEIGSWGGFGLVKSVYSSRDSGWGSLGDWEYGLGKTLVVKTQDAVAIKEYKYSDSAYSMVYLNTPPSSI